MRILDCDFVHDRLPYTVWAYGLKVETVDTIKPAEAEVCAVLWNVLVITLALLAEIGDTSRERGPEPCCMQKKIIKNRTGLSEK